MYKVVDIPGNSEYNLKGIKLLKSGKSCVYWTNKSAKMINEVVVLYDNKNVINITDNQICISLNGIDDIKTQKECLKVFCEQLKVMGLDVRSIRFKFVVADKKVQEQADEIIKSFGINGSVLNFDVERKKAKGNNQKKEKEAKLEKKIENKFNNKREITGDGDVSNIVKYDNGVRKDIVVAGNKAYDMSRSGLSMAELMKAKYEELMRDPVESEKLFNMTDEEVIKYISKLVTGKNKEYIMDNDSKSNKDSKTNVENATVGVVEEYDGIGNVELGVVRTDPRYTNNKFSVVENDNGKARVVNPETSSIGMKGNSSGTVSNINNNNDKFVVEKESSEKELTYYYLDDEGRVCDKDGKVVEGATVDLENNVYLAGEKIGVINGSLKDLDLNNNGLNNKLQDTYTFHPDRSSLSNSKSKNKKLEKKLVKPRDDDFYDNELNAAFISLPVIIFIISLLLLVGSGIIWFMTK